jgi:isoquinoline 1-oxidoreductase
VTAFECGAIINPDGVKNQIEGAVIQSIGGALFEAIQFEDGDRKDLPSARARETPIVTLAPAVSNAIFDATGERLRALPMIPNGLRVDARPEKKVVNLTPH